MNTDDSKEFKFAVESLMHSISVQMESCMRQFYEPFGLTIPQAIVLMYLRRSGQGKVTDVAKMLHMTNSNLSTICRRLERDGFLKRTRDQEDQRIVWISLTDTCQQQISQLEEQIDSRYLNNLTFISAEDRKVILDGLTRLNNILHPETISEDINVYL